MGNINPALFTFIVTMAILISACGSLIISTTNRLIRVTDLCRSYCEKVKTEKDDYELNQIFYQLEGLGPRIKLLETSLTIFYIATGCFSLTTLFMSLDQLIPKDLGIFTVGSGILGISILPIACILLVVERQITMRSIWQEIDYVNRTFREKSN